MPIVYETGWAPDPAWKTQEKWKFIILSGLELRPVSSPVRSQSPDNGRKAETYSGITVCGTSVPEIVFTEPNNKNSFPLYDSRKDIWISQKQSSKQTPWPESVSELYRPNDRRSSAKLFLMCRVVSTADPLRP
jgi:hypothetical protein